jgi:hypothetical protein
MKRRTLGVLVLVLATTLATASATSGASTRCTVDVAPSLGSPTDVYRITVSNVPVIEGSLEVRVDIRLLGTRTGSIYFAHLIPGVTEFFIDHNQAPPGEPAETLDPGRYLVRVTTPHLHGGCTTVGRFAVV